MGLSSHQDYMSRCGPLVRGLERGGELFMFLGVGSVLVALGAMSGGALWAGIVMSIGGLYMRAAAEVLAAREIEQRGVIVPPPPRPIREEDLLDLGRTVVDAREPRADDLERRFAAMIDDERTERAGIGRGG